VDAQTDGDGVADGAVRQRLQGGTPFSPGIHELTLAIVNPSPCAGGPEPQQLARPAAKSSRSGPGAV
jgi:hypothetical protein